MNKKLTVVLGIVAAFAVTAPAAAHGNQLLIVFDFHAVGPGLFEGVYATTLAHSETGATTADLVVDADGIAYSNKTLHMAGGDIFLEVEGPLSVDGCRGTVDGSWVIAGGTGDYARATGGGSALFTADLCTGDVSGAYTGRFVQRGGGRH